MTTLTSPPTTPTTPTTHAIVPTYCEGRGCVEMDGLQPYRADPHAPLLYYCDRCAVKNGFTVGQPPVEAAPYTDPVVFNRRSSPEDGCMARKPGRPPNSARPASSAANPETSALPSGAKSPCEPSAVPPAPPPADVPPASLPTANFELPASPKEESPMPAPLRTSRKTRRVGYANKVLAAYRDGQEVGRWPKGQLAAKALQVNANGISTSMTKGRPLKGYTFAWVDFTPASPASPAPFAPQASDAPVSLRRRDGAAPAGAGPHPLLPCKVALALARGMGDKVSDEVLGRALLWVKRTREAAALLDAISQGTAGVTLSADGEVVPA